MKIFSLFVFVIVSSVAFSQPPRKTVKSKSRYLIEQFEVLTTNDTIRMGNYRKYFRDGTVLLEEGQYDNNQRTGIWTFYDNKGKPELVYDYSANRVLTNNRTMLDSMGTIQRGDTNVLVRLTPSPIYLASTYQVTGILVRESRLPVHLHQAGVSQLSYMIAVTVSPTGVHYRVIPSHTDKSFYQNAKQATLLAFNDVKWLPGSYQGQDVTTIYTLPIVTLQGSQIIRRSP